jgi:hypothetical protein
MKNYWTDKKKEEKEKKEAEDIWNEVWRRKVFKNATTRYKKGKK